jgi:hypothetical protein
MEARQRTWPFVPPDARPSSKHQRRAERKHVLLTSFYETAEPSSENSLNGRFVADDF